MLGLKLFIADTVIPNPCSFSLPDRLDARRWQLPVCDPNSTVTSREMAGSTTPPAAAVLADGAASTAGAAAETAAAPCRVIADI
ncbi:hypothetical protein D3C73_1361290 [compost metagenome]